MKYQLYSDVPDSEKVQMTGSNIKYNAKRDRAEVIIIKNNLYDHTVYHPYNELDDKKMYKVYEDGWTAGSGICYNKIFIFE